MLVKQIIITIASLIVFTGTAFAGVIELTVNNGVGRSEVTMQNTSNVLQRASLIIINCVNLSGSSCGMVLGQVPLQPGQSISKTILPSDSSKEFSFNARWETK